MDKKWIRINASLTATPVLIIRKIFGGWRLYVDYKILNVIIIQDRYFLLLILKIFCSLSGIKWFIKINVRAVFYKLRVAEKDKYFIIFRIKFGLFEQLIYLFGLTGAPATFQPYINGVFGNILDDYILIYLDDILIYTSGSKTDYWRKITHILGKLKKAGLNLDFNKNAFAITSVKYLGFIIYANINVETDPEKLRAIREQETPTKL